jgi:hypothetical protein
VVMTVVEAHVVVENWAALQHAFAAGAKELPPGIVQSFLAHDLNEPTKWQIITVWASLEALMALRQPGKAPTGVSAVSMFQAAGAETVHWAFDIVNQTKAR